VIAVVSWLYSIGRRGLPEVYRSTIAYIAPSNARDRRCWRVTRNPKQTSSPKYSLTAPCMHCSGLLLKNAVPTNNSPHQFSSLPLAVPRECWLGRLRFFETNTGKLTIRRVNGTKEFPAFARGLQRISQKDAQTGPRCMFLRVFTRIFACFCVQICGVSASVSARFKYVGPQDRGCPILGAISSRQGWDSTILTCRHGTDH